MVTTLAPLIRDLVEWAAREPRSYSEMMEAWRTSRPRLTVWEEAVERGFVERRWTPKAGATEAVTDVGRRWLEGQVAKQR